MQGAAQSRALCQEPQHSLHPSLLCSFLLEQEIKSVPPAAKLERKRGGGGGKHNKTPPAPQLNNKYLGGKKITGALKIKERLLNENVEAERH